MKYFTKEVKIALVAVAGIVVLFFGLQYLKGLSVFSSDKNYYACFDDVEGLSASSPVYASGYRVGVVKKIMYDYNNPDRIVAILGLHSELVLPKGSRAEIASDLLGNVKLELRFGKNPMDAMEPGDTLEGGLKVSMASKAAEMVPQLQAMLPKLDSILTSINTLLADPALASMLHNVDQMTAHLSTTSRELSQLSASLNREMPQMLSTTNSVLANTEGVTRKLNEIDVAATMQKVDATLSNVQQMTAALNSKEGTLGLLMHDPSLYYNLNATMKDADQLMIDLKAHPKRYVHFSIFGKKDK